MEFLSTGDRLEKKWSYLRGGNWDFLGFCPLLCWVIPPSGPTIGRHSLQEVVLIDQLESEELSHSWYPLTTL
jgi:hypothetical protein